MFYMFLQAHIFAGVTAKLTGLTGVWAFYGSSMPVYDFCRDASFVLKDAPNASIRRDEHAVPLCRASNEHDAWFLQGVVHAQDRLWQMHSIRRCVQGRLCEFGGDKAWPIDTFTRCLQFRP